MKERRHSPAGELHAPARHEPVRLAIVGGGAAGMFAAAVAAERGLGCILFERKARPGAKMLMTANGRCNFTKDVPAARMLADIGDPCAAFARRALEALPPARVAAGFKSLGLRIKRMTDGRLFPAGERAAEVVHALGDLLRERSVPIAVNCRVTGLHPVKNGFIVGTPNFTLWAENVLVATGGVSFPKTGSTGDGLEFARALGHRVTPLRAGLTGFEADLAAAPFRPGRRCENALARVVAGGATVCEYRGEVEFEPWGLSGAAVYNCQRRTARMPGVPFALEVEAEGRRLRFENPPPRPLKEAIVTVGGVSLDEVDPATMESRKVPGLYFAGEVLDLDGPTGGYNLTLAFATARLAVESVLAKAPPGGIALRPPRP